MRLDAGTSMPSAMAIGATGDPELAYTAGKITALEARAAGIQWIFAPDADVNNNPDNPIINIRSFGEDPLLVAEYVSQDDAAALDAVVRLARTEGILPALESAHAVAEAIRIAPNMPAHDILVVNLSGSGDKDMGILARELRLQGV